MSSNNKYQLMTFKPAGFNIVESDPTKAGVVTMSAKKLTRKEFAEANKLDPKASDFDAKYRDYLKGLGVAKAMVIESMEQAGIPVSSMAIKRDKEGNILGGRIAWAVVKEKKTSAAQERLLALEKQNAELLAKLEEFSKRLPAPAPAPESKPALKKAA